MRQVVASVLILFVGIGCGNRLASESQPVRLEAMQGGADEPSESRTTGFTNAVTVEVFLDEDEFWGPCGIALALGYEVSEFRDTSVKFIRGGREFTVKARTGEAAARQSQDPLTMASLYIPIDALARNAGFWLVDLVPSRFSPSLAFSPPDARYFIAKYSRTVNVGVERKQRIWFSSEPESVTLGPLTIRFAGATYGLDRVLADPDPISSRRADWTEADPASLAGLFSLQVFAEIERVDGTEPLYTSPTGWVARFAVPQSDRRFAAMQPGYTYGGGQVRVKWGVSDFGWDPYDTPDKPKRQTMRFWAPAGAMPESLEYFDGKHHVKLRLVQVDNSRTNTAPIGDWP